MPEALVKTPRLAFHGSDTDVKVSAHVNVRGSRHKLPNLIQARRLTSTRSGPVQEAEEGYLRPCCFLPLGARLAGSDSLPKLLFRGVKIAASLADKRESVKGT